MPSNETKQSVPDRKPSLVLRVHVIKGKGLAAKDRSGTSDPFVTVKVGNKKQTSKVIKKSLDPVWDEVLDLELDIDPSRVLYTYLKATCWDKDRFLNDFMGDIKIDLLSLFDQSTKQPLLFENQKPSWIELNKRHVKDHVTGKLELKIGFVVLTNEGKEFLEKLNSILESSILFNKATKSKTNLISTSYSNECATPLENTSGIIILDIISASDLPYDKNVLRKSFDMDPFVVASLGTKTFKTSFIRHTLDPTWNQRIVFKVAEEENNFNIKLSLYDHDKFTNNDYIGCSIVKVSDIISQESQLDSPSSTDGSNKSSSEENSDSEKSASNHKAIPRNILALQLDLQNEFWKKSFQSKLIIRTQFKSHERIRADFWRAMFRHYDTDNSKSISYNELIMMLDSLQSTISEETVEKFFSENGKSKETESLTFAEFLKSLNTVMQKGTIEKGQPSGESTAIESGAENIVNTPNCPLCNRKFSKNGDFDRISHLAVCSSGDNGQVNRIIMGNFITEANAQRKWYTKIVSLLSYGNYKIGKNNANIIVKDRLTGELIEEKMPTYVRLGIRLLYTSIGPRNTIESSAIRNIFRNMSYKQGRKFSNPKSRKDILPFINFHKLNVEEIQQPVESFTNFNEFFYRKLKPGSRKLSSQDKSVAVSPADSRVMAFAELNLATSLWIKGKKFSISTLLGESLSKEELSLYENCSLAIFRLAPQDYHRFHIPVDGVISDPTKIEGQYYTVNPMAIRSSLDVYGENTRVVSFIDSERFGKVAYICIGAMMVGSILLTSKPNTAVSRLQEHGYFAFGGSTILLLFQKGKMEFDSDIISNSLQPIETLLYAGDSIGKSTLR